MSIKVKRAASSSSMQNMNICAVCECSTFTRPYVILAHFTILRVLKRPTRPLLTGVQVLKLRPGMCRLQSLEISPRECGPHRLAGCRRVPSWGCSEAVRYALHQYDGRAESPSSGDSALPQAFRRHGAQWEAAVPHCESADGRQPTHRAAVHGRSRQGERARPTVAIEACTFFMSPEERRDDDNARMGEFDGSNNGGVGNREDDFRLGRLCSRRKAVA